MENPLSHDGYLIEKSHRSRHFSNCRGQPRCSCHYRVRTVHISLYRDRLRHLNDYMGQLGCSCHYRLRLRLRHLGLYTWRLRHLHDYGGQPGCSLHCRLRVKYLGLYRYKPLYPKSSSLRPRPRSRPTPRLRP
jgi:hypothetical protein